MAGNSKWTKTEWNTLKKKARKLYQKKGTTQKDIRLTLGISENVVRALLLGDDPVNFKPEERREYETRRPNSLPTTLCK